MRMFPPYRTGVISTLDGLAMTDDEEAEASYIPPKETRRLNVRIREGLAMTNIVQRLYAAIHLESAEIAPRTSPLIEAARDAAYVIGKLQNALIQIRRITQEDTILDELLEPQVEEIRYIIEKSVDADKE